MKKFSIILVMLSMSASAGTCFKSHEEVSGMNKICYYKCLTGMKAITISAVSLCPLSIED